jgi:phage repressor protein C with HTH and peptisase S24 domain/DNA-binding XRE family transcriptional regulator
MADHKDAVLKHFGKRLMELMKHGNYRTERDFADALGIHPNTLTRYKNGDGSPDLKLITNLCDEFNVSMSWFLTPSDTTIEEDRERRGYSGDGLKLIGAKQLPPYIIPNNEEETEEAESKSDMVLLPRYEVSASAGNGLIPINQMPIGDVAFGRSLLRKLGGNPDHCYALEARGDSMWPTISDGDLLIADKSQQNIEDGRIYHFNAGNRVLVKRARWQLDGSLRLVSDNAAAGYKDEVYGPDKADDLRAGGRIIFAGGAPLPMRGF